MSIRLNNLEIDTYNDEDISLVLQVSDVGDLANVNSTFSKTIKIPRTPNNNQVLNQLGLTSDTSTSPYSRIRASYDKGGVSIFNRGIANIKSTNRQDYELFLQDGIVELFNLIKGIFFGQQINVDELIHEKTVQTVANAYNGQFFRYLLHDYGGDTTAETYIETLVNIDFQVPSVNLKYLWDKVFDFVGYNYYGSVFNSTDFKEAWISYPKTNSERIDEPVIDFSMDDDLSTSLYRYFDNSFQLRFWPNIPSMPQGTAPFDSNIHQPGIASQVPIESRLSEIKIDKPGVYLFKMNFDILAEYRVKKHIPFPTTASVDHIAIVDVYKNDYKILTFETNGDEKQFSNIFQQGDLVRFVVRKDYNFLYNEGYTLLEMVVKKWGGIEINILESNILDYDYLDAFRNLTPETLIKEVMQRFALTPIIDNENKIIDFYTIDEILKSDSIDWTSKYIERENEVYAMPKYAINNYFKMRYSDDNVGYADAVIMVNNENLPLERTVLESKFYAPLEAPSDVSFGVGVDFSFRQTPIWTTEINEKDDGEIEIKYKPEKDRFYWLRSKSINKKILLTSFNIPDIITVNDFNVADTLDTEMPYFINKYHYGHKILMEDFRMHNIRLILTDTDIATLDFTRLYYFRQEQQYYKLNRIVTNKDKTCNGEFIRVKIEKLK